MYKSVYIPNFVNIFVYETFNYFLFFRVDGVFCGVEQEKIVFGFIRVLYLSLT